MPTKPRFKQRATSQFSFTHHWIRALHFSPCFGCGKLMDITLALEKSDIAVSACWTNMSGCVKGQPCMKVFLRSHCFCASLVKNLNSSSIQVLHISTITCQKVGPLEELFCNFLRPTIQASFAEGQSYRTWSPC
jgi:hypothetical protein